MSGWALGDRAFCAVLMLIGGVLLAVRPGRGATRAWLVLLIAGVAHALALNLHHSNLVHSNLVHYYLGAKYPIPYGEFYKVVQAALGRPQIGIMDLDHPPATIRARPREQRAYYIDLMRDAGVAFDPLAPLDTLGRRARESGVLASEGERILAAHLPAGRIEEFRSDVRRAASGVTRRELTADYGFNGSPFYALLRHADPMLHRPFDRGTAWVSLVWQILGTFLLAWLVGAALGLETHRRLAVCALLFASWDVVGYALPGLVFVEVWIPVAVAVLAMRHRRAALAGSAIAWAGLVKLFPMVLGLHALVGGVRPRPRRAGKHAGAFAWSVRVAVACGVTGTVLGLASAAAGRSWSGFLHKIVVEFQSEAMLVNSVSSGAGLLTLGILPESPLTPVLGLAALTFTVAMLGRGGDEEFMAGLPRRSLVALASTGWLVRNWLNYYAIVPLLLLPFYARRHPRAAMAMACGMAVAFVLPDFDSPALRSSPWLHSLKLLPYLLIPVWMVGMEMGGARIGRTTRRVARVAAALLVAGVAGEVWRMRTVHRLERSGQQSLDRGDALGALESFRGWVRLAPRSGRAYMNEAIAMASLGRLEEARLLFERAVGLAPDSPAVQDNAGRLLLLQGRLEEAAVRVEAARTLTPHDPQILVVLARIRVEQGRKSEAMALLARALELEPGNLSVAALLEEVRDS